ncbi:MAG: LysR family transcriptional regulator [Deltaproteobacteria bacterium]
MTPDWDDLRVFLAVVRAESLSGAGRLLKCDASTVHRRISRLEGALNAQLFTKNPQGYSLTEVGARLLPHAERIESACDGVAEVMNGQASGLTGQIRIGAPDGCANYLLPQVVAQICDDNPGLDVQIIALPRVFNLSKREADLVISVSRPEAGRITVQKLVDYQLHLAAHRDYLTRHGTPGDRSDLSQHRVIGYIPDMIFDKELDYLAESGASAVHLASNSVAVQLNWLRAGSGIGIVHDFALPFAPELVKVLPEHVHLTRTFWLIRHESDARVERLNRFATALTDGIRREVARLEGATRA